MDSVNKFDPMTLSDAYQHALAFVEAETRRAKAGGGNIRPVSRVSGSSGLKCFNYGEPGYRQSECKKAGKRHLFANPEGDRCAAYLNGGSEVTVSKRVHVPFSVGNTYKDNVWCDVVPMDACHLLLGRPWEYDHDITHNGRTNTYSFLFGGVKITLMPNKPKEVVSKPIGTLLTLSQFEDELEIGDDVFVLIGKKVAKDSEISEAMIPLLEEFSDIFPDELPDGLPPLRDIQHHIDLEPGS
ncbi:hypothetical protein Tco_0999794 [Tanacetum coccineum]